MSRAGGYGCTGLRVCRSGWVTDLLGSWEGAESFDGSVTDTGRPQDARPPWCVFDWSDCLLWFLGVCEATARYVVGVVLGIFRGTPPCPPGPASSQPRNAGNCEAGADGPTPNCTCTCFESWSISWCPFWGSFFLPFFPPKHLESLNFIPPILQSPGEQGLCEFTLDRKPSPFHRHHGGRRRAVRRQVARLCAGPKTLPVSPETQVLQLSQRPRR